MAMGKCKSCGMKENLGANGMCKDCAKKKGGKSAPPFGKKK